MIDWTKPVRYIGTIAPMRVLCTDRPHSLNVLMLDQDGAVHCSNHNGEHFGHQCYENIPPEPVTFVMYTDMAGIALMKKKQWEGFVHFRNKPDKYHKLPLTITYAPES